MHEIIVGAAGCGKTYEIEKRIREHKGAPLLILSGEGGITPYKLALDIVASVEHKAVEPDRREDPREKKSCFSSAHEYENRLLIGAPVSLCGEAMKSFGECEIANFLFESKIEYIYEHPYEFDTRTERYAQYRPDFYLPEYGIYIEYFALDSEGRAPEHFDLGYAEGEAWKKALHEEMGTKLISLYAYEREQGELLSSLKASLKRERVKLRHRRRSELYPKKAELILADDAADFSGIVKRAAKYVESGAYICPFVHIFADDIDLMDKECIALLKSLSIPITASARNEEILGLFAEAKITRLTKKYRDPKYSFLFSHTKEGELGQIFGYLDSVDDKSRVFIIGRDSADAKLLFSPRLSLSYNREQKCVTIYNKLRPDLKLSYVSARVAEGRECDFAIVLADRFGKGDEREFESAVTRAKKGVCVISKIGEESPLAKDFRESLGGHREKIGFRCPKCGAPMSIVKGRYGDFLGCSNYKNGCNYRVKM